MCGIAKIYQKISAPIEKLRLGNMTLSLAHDGRDGAGVLTGGPSTGVHFTVLIEQISLPLHFDTINRTGSTSK
jgi:hypothetical protein